MTNTSPGLHSRFAGIELELRLDGKLPRKPISKSSSCHILNSQSFTTPSKVPELSTAKRADYRSFSASKSKNDASNTSKRSQPSAGRNPTQASPSSGRENKTAKHQDLLQFSFMRDTSSSRKKQSIQPPTNKPYTQTRSSSHSDLNLRKNYTQHLGKKRMISKNTRPADITNNYIPTLNPLNYESVLTKSASTCINGTEQKEDVYTRLYKSASKSRERLSEFKSETHVQDLNDLRHKWDISRLDKPDPPEKLVDLKIPKSLDPMSPMSPKVPKLRSLNELCHLIHQADSLLFENPHSLDPSLIPNQPILPQNFLDCPQGKELSIYERGEIMRSPAIYYVPELYSAAKRRMEINVNNAKNNYGFDDLRGNYIISMNDHIDYRYEIVKTLGTGSFGSVVLCVDHKYASEFRNRKVAVKIIKNKLNWSLQAVSEIKVLKNLMKALNGPFEDNILNYCDHFHFRGHMCIVSEALSMNLYQFSKHNGHRGVSLAITRFFLRKIIEGLEFIHKMNLVHCDIKPENIMLLFPHDYDPLQPLNTRNFKVKIIDFGSSCLKSETTFTYIQSRFYRAPEVIFGTDYGFEIDLWSLGCLAAEVFTGVPLFPGKTEIEQITFFLETFGAPSSRYILKERKLLQKSVQLKALKVLSDAKATESSPFIPAQTDERKLKRTPLFSIFGIDGKINLQALNLQLLASFDSREAHLQSGSPFRRNVKVSSRSLDVMLRLPTSNESRQEQLNFQKFLSSIFRWDPKERETASQLLESSFLETYL